LENKKQGEVGKKRVAQTPNLNKRGGKREIQGRVVFSTSMGPPDSSNCQRPTCISRGGLSEGGTKTVPRGDSAILSKKKRLNEKEHQKEFAYWGSFHPEPSDEANNRKLAMTI